MFMIGYVLEIDTGEHYILDFIIVLLFTLSKFLGLLEEVVTLLPFLFSSITLHCTHCRFLGEER